MANSNAQVLAATTITSGVITANVANHSQHYHSGGVVVSYATGEDVEELASHVRYLETVIEVLEARLEALEND